MQDFDAAGIAVYALSYDEPDALTDFSDAHKITYSLLSDPKSDVIRSFGILNTLIEPTDKPWYGIPYPGTFVINAEGVITHKFFDNNLAVRAGPEQVLRAVQGQPLLDAMATHSEVDQLPEELQMNIALDGGALVATVQRDLVISFQVPAGRHVYAEPAPKGSVAVHITLDKNEHIVQRPLIRPTSVNHTLAGTGENFEVHGGIFELRLPLTVSGRPRGNSAEISIAGEVRYQCCDDEVCDLPINQRFELQLPIADSPAVALGSKTGAALEPNAMAHFLRMSDRDVSSD